MNWRVERLTGEQVSALAEDYGLRAWGFVLRGLRVSRCQRF